MKWQRLPRLAPVVAVALAAWAMETAAEDSANVPAAALSALEGALRGGGRIEDMVILGTNVLDSPWAST